jgi:PAS domain S-box-containing protein
MDWQFTPYVLPTAASALLSFGLFAYILARRRAELHELVVRAFVLLTIAIAVWGFGDVVQLTAVTLGLKRAAIAVQFVGASTAAIALLAFALAYTDHDEWLRPVVVGPLVVEATVAFALLLTSPRHHQLYVRVVDTRAVAGFVQLDRSLGPAATAHVLVTYLVVLTAIAILVRAAVRSESVFRSQSIAVLAAVTVPFLVNVVWFVGEGPTLQPDLTVVGFGLAVFPLWYAVSRHDLLSLSPVARDGVVENMRDGVVVADNDDRVVDANPAASALIGTDSTALVGEMLTDAFPFLAAPLDDDDTALDAEDPTSAVVDTDDGRRYVDVSVQALSDHGGGRRLVILRDVTEQRRIEERYQRLIEHSSDMITVLDADGRIKYDSPAIESLLGYGQDEWLGTRARERLHPEDRDRIVEEFRRGVTEPGYTTRLEYRIQHVDGSFRVFETFASNLLRDPVVEGVVLNSRDVTERERRERDLERTNERLDEFATVVSHDLRNPLTVANGYLELARAGDEDALDEVATAHDRMERIIEDALALAREDDSVEGTTAVDVDATARSAWGSVETGAATLDAHADATVHADRSRLQRLFENLFRNAVEHGTPSVDPATGTPVEKGDVGDGAALAVTVGASRDETGAVEGFYVADDGVGIPENERGAVFESGVSSGEDGTGFGLAIVETIANAHDWAVTVGESETGGARFDITLGSEPNRTD